jgi:hypothetical protein
MSKEETLWIDADDPFNAAPATKRHTARKNFIYESMSRLVLGLDTRGKVWAYLLREQRMHPKQSISVSSGQLERLGVNRYGKYRALRSLEHAGLGSGPPTGEKSQSQGDRECQIDLCGSTTSTCADRSHRPVRICDKNVAKPHTRRIPYSLLLFAPLIGI